MAEKWNNRSLFRLLWPLIVEQFLAVSMGAADTLMVSPVGEFAVSGVNIVDNINNLLIIAFMALSTGGVVVCSQYIGRQDYDNSRLGAKQLVYIVTLVSLLLTAITLVFRRPLLSIIYGQVPIDVMDAAITYLLFSASSYPLLAVSNSCSALLRASGNSKIPMKVALVVNILHIPKNALFIYVFNMGVAGVGLSILISRFLSAAVLMTILVKNKNSPVTLSSILKIEFYPSMIKRILRIGIPSGLEQSMFQFGRLLTQRIFPVFGTSIIAANAVATTINSFGFMTGQAFSIGLLTVVGQCIGAGDYDAAKHYTKKILRMSWLFMFTVGVMIIIFRANLVLLFNLTPEARDAAKLFLNVHGVSMALFWTFSFGLPAALRASGDAKFIMFIGASSMWIVRVLAAYFLTFTLGFGPVGVWLAMGGDFITRSICFSLRWRSGRWQKIRLLD